MSNEGFDMGAAVSEIGSGLGLDLLENPAGAVDSPSGEGAINSEGVADAGDGKVGADDAGVIPAAPAPASSPEAENQAAAPTPATALEPPKSWRPEAIAEWATLKPSVQAEVLKREEDFFKGIEGYKAEAAVGRDVKQVLAPYMQTLNHYGINPMAQIQSLMQAHHTLALGTVEQKTAMVKKLIADYKIPVDKLTGDASYVDPEVQSLRSDLDSVRVQNEAVQNQLLQQRQGEIRKQLDSFAADPKNVYFNDVANDMAVLLKSGVAETLEDAYQRAIWVNPITRAKEVSRQQAETDAARVKAEQERLAKAKKATAANTRSAARGDTGESKGSMDDTMAATLREIRERV
jgi:hypothetical protein